jgi:hypothetical protein
LKRWQGLSAKNNSEMRKSTANTGAVRSAAQKDAKAAIEAMREPTEAMIKSVTDQPACLECGYDVYNSHPERPWHVMIDVALDTD